MTTMTRGSQGSRLALILLLLGSFWPLSCARPGRPPGGPEDRIPPMVVETWPEPFAIIESTRDPVVITFSERISERPTQGRLEDAVLVSPHTGETEVKHSRSGLEVSVIGGFQPDLTYRIRIRDTVKDLFNNSMEGPFELVFSTGAEFQPHVLAGVVTDRITGEPVEGARVEARPIRSGDQGAEVAEDAPAYVALTDTAGIYLLRYMPPEAFQLQVYQDNNRNREPDFREAQGVTQTQLGLRSELVDTVISSLAILQPDTIAAELIRVEAVDSILLELSFDDFLMPEEPLWRIEVAVLRDEGQEEVADLSPGPEVAHLLWQRQLDSLLAVEDSIRAADSLQVVRDSLQLVADSLQSSLPALQAQGDSTALAEAEARLERLTEQLAPQERVSMEGEEEVEEPEPEPILPESVIFARLASPLAPGQLYRVVVANVLNVNGLSGGGGSVGVTWTPPEPPPGDSTGVGAEGPETPPDTALVSLLRGVGGGHE